MMNKQYAVIQLQGNAITSQGITISVNVLFNNSITSKDLPRSNDTVRIWCRIAVSKITDKYDSFTAVKVPFSHHLHSENILQVAPFLST